MVLPRKQLTLQYNIFVQNSKFHNDIFFHKSNFFYHYYQKNLTHLKQAGYIYMLL